MITRYEFKKADKDGDYVMFSDYEELQEEVKELNRKIESAKQELL